MLESARLRRNSGKLAELYGPFTAQIKKVISDLETSGIRPRIQEAFRSPEDQLKAFNAGASKLKFGFHNIVGVDESRNPSQWTWLTTIIGRTHPTHYLIQVAKVARQRGLETGILWGLPASSAGSSARQCRESYSKPSRE